MYQPTFSQIVNSESMISTKPVKRTLNNQQLNQSAKKPAVSGLVKPQQTLKQFNSVNQYTKSICTNESSALAKKSKQFCIYLGRIDKEESVTSVNSYLTN